MDNEVRTAILAVLNNETFCNLFCRLSDRWTDESEYEDIADYADVIRKAGYEVFGMTKRPFGVKLVVAGTKFLVTENKRSGRIRAQPLP